jgi:hypothetical protein
MEDNGRDRVGSAAGIGRTIVDMGLTDGEGEEERVVMEHSW